MGKRWAADLALIAVLLLLMGYSLIGEEIHEWLGIGMLLLLIFHHAINVPWYRNLKRGRYTPYRCVQTVLTVLLLLAVLGSILSGLVLSQYVLDSTLLHRLDALARAIHLPCAYWGFLLMSLYLGLHWGAIMGRARRVTGLRAPSKCRTVILRLDSMPFSTTACRTTCCCGPTLCSSRRIRPQHGFWRTTGQSWACS